MRLVKLGSIQCEQHTRCVFQVRPIPFAEIETRQSYVCRKGGMGKGAQAGFSQPKKAIERTCSGGMGEAPKARGCIPAAPPKQIRKKGVSGTVLTSRLSRCHLVPGAPFDLPICSPPTASAARRGRPGSPARPSASPTRRPGPPGAPDLGSFGSDRGRSCGPFLRVRGASRARLTGGRGFSEKQHDVHHVELCSEQNVKA